MNDPAEDNVIEGDFSPTDFVLNEQRRPMSQAITSLGDDPEKAARAQELAQSTGQHPALVYGNLENFEEQHKAQLTHQLLSNNDFLRNYVDSHPLAAKISNDDYGQLDATSTALDKFRAGAKVISDRTQTGSGVAAKIAEGFQEGFNAQGLREDYQRLYELIDSPWWRGFVHNSGFGGAALTLEGSMRAFTGVVQGAAAGLGERAQQLGMSETWANRGVRDFIIGAQVALSGQAGFHLHPAIAAEFVKISEAAKAAKPYLESGIEPPVGIHPEIDKFKAEESKANLKSFDEVFKEAQSTKTRERSPEMFAEFVKQHTGDQKIGISADAIREMYGDKEPVPEDGKLWWVQDIKEQLRIAQETGGDIEISMSDWLAHADPEVAKALHDDMRIRSGGLTLNEIKGISAQAMVEAYHGSPHTFDAFSLDKIGTGEGAQSYGHGLYFAELKDVAKSYADTLDAAKRNSNRGYDYSSIVDQLVTQAGGDWAKAIKNLEDDFAQRKTSAESKGLKYELPKHDQELLAELKQGPPGHLYNVRINAEKEHFLDWDKLLDEQHPVVIDAIDRIENVEKHKLGDKSRGQDLHEQLVNFAIDETGKRWKIGAGFENASKILKEAGIPGIKYLDQGSRAKLDPRTLQDIKDIENSIAQSKEKIEKASKRYDEFNRETIKLETEALRDLERELETLKQGQEKDTYNYVIFDPSIIEITHRNGEAVQAVREGAALKPLFDANSPFIQDLEELYGGTYRELSPSASGIFPSELEITPVESEIMNKVNSVLDRILPKNDKKVMAARELNIEGASVRGLYQQYSDRLPVIAYAIEPESHIVARHEAIHHLRQQGFFTTAEWDVLKRAAVQEKWLDKYDIRERYPNYKGAELLEEAIADAYGHWEKAPSPDTPYHKIFEKLKELFEQIKSGLKEVFGHVPTAEEVFFKIESGEVGSREGTKPIRPEAYRQPQAMTPEIEQMQYFIKAESIGMTVDQYKKYQKLIEKRNKEDMAAQLRQATELERKKQTSEWKANEARVREEVTNDIEQRPDIAVATFFTEGRAQDGRLNQRPKIGAKFLSAEQKAGLPKELYSKDGINPDDIAGYFGYQSGDMLVNRLMQTEAARGDIPFKDFVKSEVEAETQRRMEKQYGKLDENILEEAKDHVLSETQMDLLHEETMALGMQAGSQMPFTKADFKSWVQTQFADLKVAQVSSDKFLKEAGKSGRLAEMALLKGEPTEAFKNKQRQYLSTLLAQEAKNFEKAVAKFDRSAKKYSKREVDGTAPEYTNFIQDILMRVGKPVRRSVQDLQDAISKEGYKSLDEFNNSKSADLRDLHIPDFLLDPNFRKTIDELSTEEFAQLHDAIKALDFNGRNELKIEKAGEAHDLKEVIKEMNEAMASLGDKKYPIDRAPSKIIETGKSWWWSGITVESMLNRIDRDNPRGVMNQFIVRQFTEASNYKDRLIKEHQAKMAEVGKIPDMDKLVDNPLFVDPLSGEKFTMRRRNVLGILQNVGNANNLKKLAEGYGIKPAQLMDWLGKVTTKEDWDRAQKIGDIFDDIFKMADRMSHSISGVGIQKLELAEINSPFGTYKGWYNPIKYDSLRPGKSKALLGPNVPEAEGYYRATTPQGYTNQRTGYIAPVELNLDIVPIRMKQMLHDIAVRPAVIQMSKVFYNPEFKKSMIKHFGEHQAEEMIPFLRDFANNSNFKSMADYMGNNALEFFRQNTITTLIGFNPSTVMKHGPTALINSLTEVGVKNFAREFATLLNDDGSGKRNWTMAMEKSEELQRRMRNYSELFAGHGSEINLKGTANRFLSFREFMMHAAATPVSISDLLSAVPTFLAKYKEEIAKGSSEGDAVNDANRAVRHAHGSSVLTNKPSIARNSSALGAYFTSLYGFFSHMQQKQYELAWKAKDTLKGDTKTPFQWGPDLVKGLFSYIIAPAVIEELVTPISDDNHKHTWGRKAATTLGLGISSSLIGVRDVIHSIMAGRDPQMGLMNTTAKPFSDIVRDLKRPMSKDTAAKTLKDTFALTGVLTGLTNAQEGRAAEYLYRYYNGMEKPKGPWDVAIGMRYGKTDKHSRSLDQWLKQH